MAQSEMLSQQMLLSASCWQSFVKGDEVWSNEEAITMQSRAVSAINAHFREKTMKDVGLEAIAAVLYFAMNEVRSFLFWETKELMVLSQWYWGEIGRFWKHMQGLKDMLRLRGGLVSIPASSFIRTQLIV